MGSLALDSEMARSNSNLYLALGLNESRKGVSETPRVLSLLSSFLERTVLKNEKLSEGKNKNEMITIFHGFRAPNLSIRRYIHRIFKYSNCSPSCFVLANIYMDRFLCLQPETPLTSLNAHRLLITSVVAAAKFIDDAFFNNTYYAKVGGVSTAEMNMLELKFLFTLDFRLHVSLGTFDKQCLQLEQEGIEGGYQIERPIQVCGLKGWNSKEESNVQPGTPSYSSCETV